MRRFPLLLAAIGPLALWAAFTLPTRAQSARAANARSEAPPPLDLEAIPAKPVAGPLGVRGGGEEDDAEESVRGRSSERPVALDDDGPEADGEAED